MENARVIPEMINVHFYSFELSHADGNDKKQNYICIYTNK